MDSIQVYDDLEMIDYYSDLTSDYQAQLLFPEEFYDFDEMWEDIIEIGGNLYEL